MGETKSRIVVLFIGSQADMSIAQARVRSVGVDVSIAKGILMFIWAKPKAELTFFLLVPRLT